MLGEAFDFLVQEAYRTKPVLRQVSQIAERIVPGSGRYVAPVYIGFKAGTKFGTIAGKSAQQTMERGGFVVFAPSSGEIDRYDRSALGSTRII
tara:strand:- start:1481 stop:1759 length:279 start_codon:yes stop_codon:yes gene_type:complete